MKVRMEFVEKSCRALGLMHKAKDEPNVYALWLLMKERGVKISTNGVRNYVIEDTKSIRLDFLMALQELCAEAGISLPTFWGWVKKDVNKMR